MKLELLSLRSGGSNGRFVNEDDQWTFSSIDTRTRFIAGNESDSDSSDFSTGSSFEEEEDIELEFDEMESNCIRHLKGNRILEIEKICEILEKKTVCRKCAIQGHTNRMKDFIAYTVEYENKIKEEEDDEIFYTKKDRFEFRLEKKKCTQELYQMFCGGQENSIEEAICKSFTIAEETFGVATSLIGVCRRSKRSHTFRIDAERISENIRSTFHKNAKYKKYAINYRLCAALQQMGCGNTDAATLAGFLDLPVTGDVMNNS